MYSLSQALCLLCSVKHKPFTARSMTQELKLCVIRHMPSVTHTLTHGPPPILVYCNIVCYIIYEVYDHIWYDRRIVTWPYIYLKLQYEVMSKGSGARWLAGWGDTVPCRVLRALCQMLHVLRPAQCAPPHTCNKRGMETAEGRDREGRRGKGQGGERKEGEGWDGRRGKGQGGKGRERKGRYGEGRWKGRDREGRGGEGRWKGRDGERKEGEGRGGEGQGREGRGGTGRERKGREGEGRWKGRNGEERATEFEEEKLTAHIQTSLIVVLVATIQLLIACRLYTIKSWTMGRPGNKAKFGQQ